MTKYESACAGIRKAAALLGEKWAMGDTPPMISACREITAAVKSALMHVLEWERYPVPVDATVESLLVCVGFTQHSFGWDSSWSKKLEEFSAIYESWESRRELGNRDAEVEECKAGYAIAVELLTAVATTTDTTPDTLPDLQLYNEGPQDSDAVKPHATGVSRMNLRPWLHV